MNQNQNLMEEEFELVDGDVRENTFSLSDMTSEDKALIMAQNADSLRASDIVLLDLRGLTIIADFFLICTGNSSIQLRAVADKIEEKLRDMGVRKLRMEGYREATWILLDYGDVVAHIMAAEQREFYNIEAFWGDAPRVELDLVREPTTAMHNRFDAPDEIDDEDDLDEEDELDEDEVD